MLGTLSLLDEARPAISLARLTNPGCVATGWSEMFVPFALSIATASFAIACYHTLSAMIEGLRVETNADTLQLLNDLVRPSTNN